MYNYRLMKELYNPNHGKTGAIPPEPIHSTLVVDDHLIDIRSSSPTGMTTITTGISLPEPRREEPGNILEPIHALLLAQYETRSRADSISPRGLVRPIIQYFNVPAAKNPAVLPPMNSDSRE